MCQKISMRLYASSPRKVDTRDKEERDHKELRRAQVALPIGSAYQPRHSLGGTSVRESIVG